MTPLVCTLGLQIHGKLHLFSLRAYEASLVNFLSFLQGSLVGNVAGILWGFHFTRTHRIKALY